MRTLASAALAALLVQEAVHDHGTRGAVRPIDLAAVARVHERAIKAFAWTAPRAEAAILNPATPDWPACRFRSTRRAKVEPLPEGLPPLYFAKAGRPAPEGALAVGSAGDREAGARLGVRCLPTLVRRIDATEVELVEGE